MRLGIGSQQTTMMVIEAYLIQILYFGDPGKIKVHAIIGAVGIVPLCEARGGQVRLPRCPIPFLIHYGYQLAHSAGGLPN